MAKKKAKKKNKAFGLVLGLLALLLGLLAIVLFLVRPMAELYIGDKVISDTGVSGLALAFGYKGTLEALEVKAEIEILKLSFMNILPLILIVLGVLLILPKSRAVNIIGAVLAIAGGVVVLFAGSLAVYSDAFTKAIDLFKKINSGIGGLFGNDKAIFVGYKMTTDAYTVLGLAGGAGLIGLIKGLLKK